MEHLAQEESRFEEDSEGFFAEHEMDELFDHLPQIMPPASLIDNIMAAVARIPLSEIAVSMMPLDILEDFPISSMPGQHC